MPTPTPIRGRGAGSNPANRFEPLHLEPDPDADLEPDKSPGPATQFFKDATQSVLAYNDSPDLGFDVGLNPYRGCEHGCAYCYARPTHEYLGFSAGLDFESRIMVKTDAPELLRRELSSKKWRPQVIALSGVTDPYQPVERRLQITRQCLAVLAEFRNPVTIVTKNQLVTRDIDLLKQLADYRAAAVFISVTSLDNQLIPRLEPRTPLPKQRLAAISALSRAGIPVGVLTAPVIPGLNDHELPAILDAAAKAGAQCAGYVTLRLPHGLGPLFEQWLEQHASEKKEKVLNRIKSMRGGKLNDSRFGSRMRGEGLFAKQIEQLFHAGCRRVGLNRPRFELSSTAFRIPERNQLSLF
jgi:DNA repair photolyase